MLTPSEFFYKLPSNLIANDPLLKRDQCRLLTVNRHTSELKHCRFYQLPDLLTANDVLVLNQSKVFPARIIGQKSTGGQIETLLLKHTTTTSWQAISSPRPKIGTIINFDQNLSATVTQSNQSTGEITIEFNQSIPQIYVTLDQIGHTPIPPYIHSSLSESDLRHSYQTVYAKSVGSAAAPTAGLHFTPTLLSTLKNRGVQIEYLTLHVGLGTFQPLRSNNLISGKLHPETFEISTKTASRLNQAKKNGKRIIAVGTTTVRTLESSVNQNATISYLSGTTDIFIYPPYKFQFVNCLITNFHLPESSLLMLITAFASYPNTPHKYRKFQDTIIYNAYQSAINQKYLFFSFGDAMWIY